MDRIDQLQVFVKIVETGGFTSAGNDLGIPRSTVSTIVRDLERRFASRLLFRTTRKVAPTHEGMILYRHGLGLLDTFNRLESELALGERPPAGKLRIDVASRIASQILAPALPRFFELYPNIEIEFRASDRIADLIEESVDCVIRIGPLRDSRLVARKIAVLDRIHCASPEYLARCGTPQNAADLTKHQAVNYFSPAGRILPWEFVENGVPRAHDLVGCVTVNSAETFVACALAGLGLIQIPELDVRPHLLAGRLIEVLPNLRATPMHVTALYPHRQPPPPRLTVFLNWATPILRAALAAAHGPDAKRTSTKPKRRRS